MKYSAFVLLGTVSAQFGFFDQMFGGPGGMQQNERVVADFEPRVNNIVENTYNGRECNKFLCEDTLECVKSPYDCPCPFPDSQLRCPIPDGKGFICVSKPTNEDGPDCDSILKYI